MAGELLEGRVEERIMAYLLDVKRASYYKVAKDLKLPESTVYRHLKALEDRGLVKKDCREFVPTPRGLAWLFYSTEDRNIKRRCVNALIKYWGVETDEGEVESFLSWLLSVSAKLKVDPVSLPFCDALGLALFAYSRQDELTEDVRPFVVKVLLERMPSVVTEKGCKVVAVRSENGHFVIAGKCKKKGYALNFVCDDLLAIAAVILTSLLGFLIMTQ